MKPSIKVAREYQNDHELFGDSSDGEFLFRETTYNAEGKILSTISYVRKDLPEQRITNEYDNKGRLVSEIVEYLMEGLSERNTFEYDEKDRIVAQKKFYDDGTFELTANTYDDAAHSNTALIYDADGVLENKQVTVHDAAGNILSATSYSSDGRELSREEFVYNDKNKPLQHTVVDLINNSAEGAVYIYNDQGYLQEVKKLNEKGNQVAAEHYHTDERGNILSMESDDNLHGTSQLVFESQYDEKNQVLLMVYYTESGIPKRKDEYIYDENGNITEQSHFLMNVARGSNEHYTRRFEYEFFQ